MRMREGMKIQAVIVVALACGGLVAGCATGGKPPAAPSAASNASAGAEQTHWWDQIAHTSYVHPVTPETDPDVWGEENPTELVKRLQIPRGQLSAMPTEELVSIVLSWPYFGNFGAHDRLQDGFDSMRAQFPAYGVLLGRLDARDKLLELYRSVDLSAVRKQDEFAWIRLECLELLIAQPEVLESGGKAGRTDIVREIMRMERAKITTGWSRDYSSSVTRLALVRAANLDDPAFAQVLRDEGEEGQGMLDGWVAVVPARGHEQMQLELDRALERAYGVSSAEPPTPTHAPGPGEDG